MQQEGFCDLEVGPGQDKMEQMQYRLALTYYKPDTVLKPFIWIILFKLPTCYEVVITDDKSEAHKILNDLRRLHKYYIWSQNFSPNLMTLETVYYEDYTNSIIKNCIYSHMFKVSFQLTISTLCTMHFTTTNEK